MHLMHVEAIAFEHAAKGAMLFDKAESEGYEEFDKWYDKIDLSRLRVFCPNDCPAGQVYGWDAACYGRGPFVNAFNLGDYGLAMTDGIPGDRARSYWHALDRGWAAEIRHRRHNRPDASVGTLRDELYDAAETAV